MSYTKLILNDDPLIIWSLDDIVSGTQRSASSRSINFISPFYGTASIVVASTTVSNQPIVFGSKFALDIDTASYGLSIPALGLFSEQAKNREYCIEFWLKLERTRSEEKKIFLRRGSTTNGLFIENNNIIFRCGDSDRYVETYQSLSSIDEPLHIVAQYSNSSIDLIINGNVSSTAIDSSIYLQIDQNFESNDYIDFYGHQNYDCIVDCIAIYGSKIGKPKAIRHYMYGIGHSVEQEVFSTRGGQFYNLSLSNTRPTYKRTFSTYDDYNFFTTVDYENIFHNNDGMRVYVYDAPLLTSLDNKITKLSTSIRFTSSVGNTEASFIDIPNSNFLVNDVDGIKPIFLRGRFSGEWPDKLDSQTVFSISKSINEDMLRFDLYNSADESSSVNLYKIVVRSDQTDHELSFDIPSTSSSPEFWMGVNFTDKTIVYFGTSTSGSITTASYQSGSVDPLITYSNRIPDTGNIRIGSRYSYTSSDTIDTVGDPYQFYGQFTEFIVTPREVTASFNSMSSITSSSKQSKYYRSFWSNAKNKFVVSSYGKAEFNLPCHNFLGSLENSIDSIAANRIDILYPNVEDSAEVDVYVSGYKYGPDIEDDSDDTIFKSRTAIRSENSFRWINNVSLYDKYLKFEIEMFANDSLSYPPIFKGIVVSTYGLNLYNSSSYTTIEDNIRLYPNSELEIFLPETNKTPTAFLRSNSGIKLNRNVFDVRFAGIPRNFDPSSVDGLQVWLDSRFPNGFGVEEPLDNQEISLWKDLSGLGRNADQNSHDKKPRYRFQSLNMLTLNESNGSESGSVTLFTSSGATLFSSNRTAISGFRSIRVKPTGTLSDSYMQTSSIGGIGSDMHQGETYTAVGTITLLKPQTSSSTNARKIVAFVKTSGSYTQFSSSAAPNASGDYTLSVRFSTASTSTEAFVRYYNGASALSEAVFWDDLGIYSGSVISGSPVQWHEPMRIDGDNPTLRFDGNDFLRIMSPSFAQPLTIYIVGRSFDSYNSLIGGTSNNDIVIYNASAGRFGVSAGTDQYFSCDGKKFNVITAIFNGASSSVYLNGASAFVGNLGTTGISASALLIGDGRIHEIGVKEELHGDLTSVLIYSGAHSTMNRQNIESWLTETWGVS